MGGSKNAGGGGGGGGKRSSGRSSSARRRNPRRGGPGILITCERGREFKATREGTEILRHYYYQHLGRRDERSAATADDDGGEGANGGVKTNVAKETTAGEETKESGNNATTTTTTSATKNKMTLEEEIAMLKSGATTDDVLRGGDDDDDGGTKRGKGSKDGKGYDDFRGGPFQVYETGCCGVVCIMCTAPGASLLPDDVHKSDGNDDDDNEDDGEGSKTGTSSSSANVADVATEPNDRKRGIEDTTASSSSAAAKETTKRAKTTTTTETTTETTTATETTTTETTTTETTATETTTDVDVVSVSPSRWDPIETVRDMLRDAKLSGTASTAVCDAPCSRFVTRTIPLQATCFASDSQITTTAKCLVDRFMNNVVVDEEENGGEKRTFGITLRRRNCSNVKKEDVVSKVAALVDPTKYKVNLTKPDYTIAIEICRTLCGVSIIRNAHEFEKFNLLSARQNAKEGEQ